MPPNSQLPWPKKGLLTEEETRQFPHLEFLPETAYPGFWRCISPYHQGVVGRGMTLDGRGNWVPMPDPQPTVTEPVVEEAVADDEEDDGDEAKTGQGQQASGSKGRKKIHSDRMKAVYDMAKKHYAHLGANVDVAQAAAKVFNVVCAAEIRAKGRQPFTYTALESTWQANTHGGPTRVAHWERIKRDIADGLYDGLRREIEDAARQI